VAITYSQDVRETLDSCNPFQTASPSVSSAPWIPITPDSDEGPNLDKKWAEDDTAEAGRRLD
jgi:hypothetical protein